jgi:Taurine catabolism dioxygenase TauD, TfdA family
MVVQETSANTTARHREPATPFQPVIDPAEWRAEDLRASGDHLVHLTDSDRAEIDAAIRRVAARGVPIMKLTGTDFELPTLGRKLAAVRDEILNGRGFAQIRGFEPERYAAGQQAIAFWGISMHLGERVASQNAKGHVLGHITNIGETIGNPNQRGPYSRDRIPFHVDCCDIVGLMCINPAKSGGESSLASSIAVHNELVRRRPDLAPVLAEPYYRDRRGEVPAGMAPWYKIPIFNYNDGVLSLNIEPTYIGSAHRHPGVPATTPLQREAVEYIQALAEELSLDIDFERGDMQFLNNHVTMHTRQSYEDYAEPARKRHLLRIWVIVKGCRPLPRAYFARHGDPDRVDWPGGIVGPDTVLNAPIGVD